MNMKLLAILGSPRKGGNTDILTQRVLDGANEAGVETEVIALRSLKIAPCIACDKCWQIEGRPCAFKDDMPYDAIAAADILLFATPVYWYAPTAIMKAFMDRLVPANRPEGRHLLHGKQAILVSACEEKGPAASELLVRMFELGFEYLDVRVVGKVIADDVGPAGAVLNKPEALEAAYNIGWSLSSS